MIELLISACVMVVLSVARPQMCDIDIAQYCCRNETRAPLDGFEVTCFERNSLWDGSPLDRSSQDTDSWSAAFRILFEYGAVMTVHCTTAAPNVPSLLTLLKIAAVTNLVYKGCEVPQGNLTFAEILDGNSFSVSSMLLENPLHAPDQILQGALFNGISAGIINLHITLETDNETLDLSEDFFKNFESLRYLQLSTRATRALPDLKPLKNLNQFSFSKAAISEISSEVFSGLTSLNELYVEDLPVTKFGSKPFWDLERLTLLRLSSLGATEIPGDLFFGLNRLSFLNIERWFELTSIAADAFSGASSLSYLHLESLPKIEELPVGIFQRLEQLRNLNIVHCGLKKLPLGIWSSKEKTFGNLLYVKITHNEIETLPDNFFEGNARLRSVNLEQNRFREVGRSLRGANSLEDLNLYGNDLRSILKGDFNDLEALVYLNLSNNRIEFIESGSFETLKSLQTLILGSNKLQHFDNLITTENRVIQWISLPKNEIKSFPNVPWGDLRGFSFLDMGDNLLTSFDVPQFLSESTTVYLSRNRIELIFLTRLDEQMRSAHGRHSFYIDNNPIVCSGENFMFLNYIQNSMRPDIALFQDLENYPCKGTAQTLLEVNVKELSVGVEACPEKCECSCFPSNASCHVRCQHKNLEKVPTLPPEVTHLDFEDNALTVFPDQLSICKSLRVVNLRQNRLRTVDEMFKLAPPNLRILYLESNLLERLHVPPDTVLKFRLGLSDNPWKCDCESKNFKPFLDNNSPRILNYSAIECKTPLEVDGRKESSLQRISLQILCPARDPKVWILSSSFSVVFSLLLLSVILYFKNRTLVTAFMYIHFNALFQLMSSDEDLDGAKEFDAFISYSTHDREIAMEILQELESTESKSLKQFRVQFTLCFHERDFVAGQSITWNIQRAVQSSRRTIVILSEGFLESSWFKLEFDAAYNQMCSDRANRMIVVINGNVPKLDDLDENLRAVLTTRTYLVWGERWFWKKLLYAMPHKHRLAEQGSDSTTPAQNGTQALPMIPF